MIRLCVQIVRPADVLADGSIRHLARNEAGTTLPFRFPLLTGLLSCAVCQVSGPLDSGQITPVRAPTRAHLLLAKAVAAASGASVPWWLAPSFHSIPCSRCRLGFFSGRTGGPAAGRSNAAAPHARRRQPVQGARRYTRDRSLFALRLHGRRLMLLCSRAVPHCVRRSFAGIVGGRGLGCLRGLLASVAGCIPLSSLLRSRWLSEQEMRHFGVRPSPQTVSSLLQAFTDTTVSFPVCL